MSTRAATREVRFEQFRVVAAAGGATAGYGIGRVQPSPQDPHAAPDPARILAAGASGQAAVQSADADTFIALPAGLAAERALILPRLARVLAAWDQAGLELGENAIVTSGSEDAGLFCLVAVWRTGRSPSYLDLGDGPAPAGGIATVVPAADPQAAIERLASRVQPASGTAAVVLSASARSVDILLEALPKWGRILLAAPQMEPAAIDFYNHVHRKGATLLAAPSDAMCVFDPALRPALEPHVRRAARVLEHEALAASCLQQAV